MSSSPRRDSVRTSARTASPYVRPGTAYPRNRQPTPEEVSRFNSALRSRSRTSALQQTALAARTPGEEHRQIKTAPRVPSLQPQQPLGSVKSRPAVPAASLSLPIYDGDDRGPEDRMQPNAGCRTWADDVKQAGFSIYDALVKGVMILEGVNYSMYEAAKEQPARVESFHRALKDDLISEIGNSVRPDDIVLRVIPGQIKTVILHYDTQRADTPTRPRVHRAHPQLVDAEWCMKVDYVIRARDVQRQQNVAMALYTAFTSDGFAGQKATAAYVKAIDPGCDVRNLRFKKPEEEKAKPAQPMPQRALASPRRPSFSIPMDAPQVVQQPQAVQQPLVVQQQPNASFQSQLSQPEPAPQQILPFAQQHPQMASERTIPAPPPRPVVAATTPAVFGGAPAATPVPLQRLSAGSSSGLALTPTEVEEKDKQLARLEEEIGRERQALRSLATNVPFAGVRQKPTESVFTYNKPLTVDAKAVSRMSPMPDVPTVTRPFLPSGSYIHEF